MLSRAAAGAGTSARAATAAPASKLHVRVIGASAAFGSDPVDVLGGVLDVARLAVDAILGVDLKPRFTVLAVDKFINSSRTVTLFGSGIDGQVDCRWYVGVLERQMNRLVFFMIGVRDEHRRQTVEGQHAVGLRIVDRSRRILALQSLVVGLVPERPRHANSQLVQPHVESGVQRSQGP